MARIKFGDLRRVTPVARHFGFDRGQPVDRYYIERFLTRNALAIRGHVLEFGDAGYTQRFGGNRVTRSDVWHPTTGNPAATIVGDLVRDSTKWEGTFDCIICTQTLQYIFDTPGAAKALHAMLKPGGAVLATVPGISQIDDPAWQASWCWSFTAVSAARLFRDAFGQGYVEVETHGNVLASTAFLHGLATDELTEKELDSQDPAYPLVVTVKAFRSAADTLAPESRQPAVSVVIPCFNQAPFLGEAIESALGQKDSSVEVIVVDDGSSDNTAEVAGRYPGVTLLEQPNRGLGAARNAGLRHSAAAYVVFLDADDRLLPDALANGMRTLLTRPDCAFVSGHHRFIDVVGRVTHEWARPVITGDRYGLLLQQNYISMGAAVIFARAALEMVDAFDERLDVCEDYDLYLRLARRFPVCDHEQIVAEYRRHGRAMTDDPSRMLIGALRVLEGQREFTRGHSRYETARQAGLQYWRGHYGAQVVERGHVASLIFKAPREVMRLVAASARRMLRGRSARLSCF